MVKNARANDRARLEVTKSSRTGSATIGAQTETGAEEAAARVAGAYQVLGSLESVPMPNV